MIVYDNKAQTFTLQTRSSTFQMWVDPHRVLIHTWYGSRIQDADLRCFVRYADRGFSPNINEVGNQREYSLDTLPQEYSSCGTGDFRLPSLRLELADGSELTSLRYEGFSLRKGKYALEGMPAFYGKEADADTLVIRMRDETSGVEVELYYGVLEEFDLITRAVRVTNQSGQTIKVRQVASLCLDMQHADMDMITFDGSYAMERIPHREALRSGVQSVGSMRGASSHHHNPFIILCDHDTNEDYGACIGVMMLYSGNFEAAVEVSQFDNTRLTMGIHPYHFCQVLEPGASFLTPEAAMIYSGEGFGHMSRQFHRSIRTHLIRDLPGHPRKPVLINSWEATYFTFTADKLAEIAGKAAPLGIELFVMDDGWFGRRDDDTSGLGDWKVNEKKLPGGLTDLVPRIQKLGMKFGIWMEPEMISEDSDLYRTHPDWVLGPKNRPLTRSRFQLTLDFSREDVREYVYQSLKKVLDSADISYLKWDVNRNLTDVWSVALPADRQGEVFHRYILGVYSFLERLRTEYPNLLIEGCGGGGGRFDGGMLYYTPHIWCSDNTDAIDRLKIQYGTSFCYPLCATGSHVSGSPNDGTGRVTSMKTRGTVAMAGVFGYELDLSRVTAEDLEAIQEQVKFYQEHYDLILYGDYYRLTSPFGDSPFTAWQQVSEDRQESLVSVVFSMARAARPFYTVRMKGLDPDTVYELSGETDGEVREYRGDMLMNAGCPLPEPKGDYPAWQLYLKAKATPAAKAD